jgi:hypothetical protein
MKAAGRISLGGHGRSVSLAISACAALARLQGLSGRSIRPIIFSVNY